MARSNRGRAFVRILAKHDSEGFALAVFALFVASQWISGLEAKMALPEAPLTGMIAAIHDFLRAEHEREMKMTTVHTRTSVRVPVMWFLVCTFFFIVCLGIVKTVSIGGRGESLVVAVSALLVFASISVPWLSSAGFFIDEEDDDDG